MKYYPEKNQKKSECGILPKTIPTRIDMAFYGSFFFKRKIRVKKIRTETKVAFHGSLPVNKNNIANI